MTPMLFGLLALLPIAAAVGLVIGFEMGTSVQRQIDARSSFYAALRRQLEERSTEEAADRLAGQFKEQR